MTTPRQQPAQDLESLSDMLGAFGPCDALDLHLMALLGADEQEHEAALDYLDSAVIYEGTPFPVTAAAGTAVAELLSDPRSEAVRPELLRFIQMVAECGTQFDADLVTLKNLAAVEGVPDAVSSAVAAFRTTGSMSAIDALFENEEMADAILARSILSCVDAAPALRRSVEPFADDDDDLVRDAARSALEEISLLVRQYA
ncbi:hypothetical protein JT358_16425 [Micrococcales bacterium 31B]|nr:hypothetical protein [Micrococcales bacterium 31B]